MYAPMLNLFAFLSGVWALIDTGKQYGTGHHLPSLHQWPKLQLTWALRTPDTVYLLFWPLRRCVIFLHCKFTKPLVNFTHALYGSPPFWSCQSNWCSFTYWVFYLFLLIYKNLLIYFWVSLVILYTEKSFSYYVNLFWLR